TMKAYRAIQDLFFKNEILPGQQLNSRNLGEMLGMSQTPVIQALKLLHYQGFLSHVPNQGYKLKKNTIEQVEEIFNLRLAIEPFCLENILVRIDPAGWKKLDNALDDFQKGLESNNLNLILLADIDFHTTMAAISIGKSGANIVKNLFELLYLKNRETILYNSPRKNFLSHHKKILEHLKKQDAKAAKKLLTRHIIEVKETLILNMRKSLEDIVSFL
ncbi:MAG: GntR family transcriptional regulator, partial [Proteobacteria bacterium]|nr:GntR family transcriptional regulator [Pseudomonadota bacterium]